MRIMLFAAFVLVAVGGILYFLGDQRPDLQTLRAQLDALETFRNQNPMLLSAIFLAVYVAVAAFSLPIAVWMTLAGGALFGFWWGLVLVSFASTIGATLAFLVARFLLRDWVRSRMGERVQSISDSLDRDGPFYLFTLRLIPAVPFFVLNLVMGLTRIRPLTFFLVSQAGMLPGTAVYVNAGTQLAGLESVSGILSPTLLASFALLGLFPWIARMVLNLINRRRAYAGWKKPKRFDRNLVVIGAGAAGLVSAYIGAATKAKVALVEAHKMGGDCLNYGCVPSKTLIRTAKLAHEIRNAEELGVRAQTPDIDFPGVMRRVGEVISRIEPHDSVERYEGLGVQVLKGYARLVDPWTIEVTSNDNETTRLTTRATIVATGARPFVPDIPGLDRLTYLTSDTLWERMSQLTETPGELVVLGGGPIGCELAQAFARLGSRVTQIEMTPRLMTREDEEVSELVESVLRNEGVNVLTGHEAVACGTDDDGNWIEVRSSKATTRIGFDEIIVAVGRAARLEGFGLEELDIPTDRVVATNEYLQTRLPNILAAGDVAGPYQFTHAAGHQAWFATINALFGDFWRLKADYRVMPWVTFLDPEIARVGLNEQDARAKGIEYEVYRYEIADLDRAIAEGSTQGFVKVLTVPGKDRILGVTIVARNAGEMVAEFVLAMKHGLGLRKILGTVHAYPTWAEANKFTAGAWQRSNVSARALALSEHFHRWRRG